MTGFGTPSPFIPKFAGTNWLLVKRAFARAFKMTSHQINILHSGHIFRENFKKLSSRYNQWDIQMCSCRLASKHLAWWSSISIWWGGGPSVFSTQPAKVRFAMNGENFLFALGWPMFVLTPQDFLFLEEVRSTNMIICIHDLKIPWKLPSQSMINNLQV